MPHFEEAAGELIITPEMRLAALQTRPVKERRAV